MCVFCRIGSLFLSLLLGLTVQGAAAQPATELERLREVFEAGDASAVLDSAAERVEVVLLGNGKQYSRAQATYVLEAFFRDHPPAGFTLEHTSNAEESWFAFGVYEVKNGAQPFQVYLRLRQRGEQWELREIRIEQRQR